MKIRVVILVDEQAFSGEVIDLNLTAIAERERQFITADAIGASVAKTLEMTCPKTLIGVHKPRWLARVMASISTGFTKEEKPDVETIRNVMPGIRASVGDWRKYLSGQNLTPIKGGDAAISRKPVVYGRPDGS